MARPDIKSSQGQKEGIGARVAGDAVGGIQIGGELFLKLVNCGTANVTSRGEYVGDSSVNFWSDRPILAG